jgi:hypothetical protein
VNAKLRGFFFFFFESFTKWEDRVNRDMSEGKTINK